MKIIALFLVTALASLSREFPENFAKKVSGHKSIVTKLPDDKGIIIEFPEVEKKEIDKKAILPRTAGRHPGYELLMDKWEQTVSDESQKKDKNDYKLVKFFGDSQGEYLDESMKNGLMGAMFFAYNSHLPLALRPDDLWLSILSTFNLYVTNHSEQMRGIFVDHKGKKDLVVTMSEHSRADQISDQELSEFIKNMALKIKENTKGNIYKWMMPNFTTTTPNDRLIAEISLMSSMSNYFTYTGMMACGISKVQLEGTLEDWKILRKRASMLRNFGGRLAQWGEVLVYVLDHFVDARAGKADYNFWQRIISQDPRGSGGDKNSRGWFMAFSPFSVDGKIYFLNPLSEIKRTGAYVSPATPLVLGSGGNTIAATIVSAPVKLKDQSGNGLGEVLLIGGLNNPTYNPATKTIRPAANWAVAVKK